MQLKGLISWGLFRGYPKLDDLLSLSNHTHTAVLFARKLSSLNSASHSLSRPFSPKMQTELNNSVIE
jgi:hypothetical protein